MLVIVVDIAIYIYVVIVSIIVLPLSLSSLSSPPCATLSPSPHGRCHHRRPHNIEQCQFYVIFTNVNNWTHAGRSVADDHCPTAKRPLPRTQWSLWGRPIRCSRSFKNVWILVRLEFNRNTRHLSTPYRDMESAMNRLSSPSIARWHGHQRVGSIWWADRRSKVLRSLFPSSESSLTRYTPGVSLFRWHMTKLPCDVWTACWVSSTSLGKRILFSRLTSDDLYISRE